MWQFVVSAANMLAQMRIQVKDWNVNVG